MAPADQPRPGAEPSAEAPRGWVPKHSAGPPHGPRVWSRPDGGWIRWYLKLPRRRAFSRGWDIRGVLLGIVLGPAMLFGGISGLLAPRDLRDGLEALAAVGVGLLATTCLVLYFVRPPTAPELPPLSDDIDAMKRWWRERRDRRRLSR